MASQTEKYFFNVVMFMITFFIHVKLSPSLNTQDANNFCTIVLGMYIS